MSGGKKAVIYVALLALLAAAGGWASLKLRKTDLVPEGIVAANGRVEANQVEIATKLAGRVTEIAPREGDMVDAGSAFARIDSAEIEAQLRQAQAETQRARKSLAAATASLASRKAELTLAEQELKRASALLKKGYATRQRYDQRVQQVDSAKAAVEAGAAQIEEAQAAIKAAEAQVDRLKTLLGDTTIVSPVRGRVQYRLVEPGAVLPAGGRIATVLDLTDVYMTVFLPARDAARLTVGDEARIVLDAAPDYVFPTTVSFVAAEAQFTPKTVETRTEREKLMFRVKLQAPRELLEAFESRVKTGLRGVGYVRVSPMVSWPAKLDVKLPK
jgi:HlyD family secretion protein